MTEILLGTAFSILLFSVFNLGVEHYRTKLLHAEFNASNVFHIGKLEVENAKRVHNVDIDNMSKLAARHGCAEVFLYAQAAREKLLESSDMQDIPEDV